MARQRIDLDINTQRLLGANKERAAANRSAYVDREERKRTAAQTAAAATPAAPAGAPTQKEEPRGGTPDLYSPPEPAATRRKKKGVEVYGISNIGSAPVAGTYEESAQPFTAYAAAFTNTSTALTSYNVISFTQTNTYALQNTFFRPEFNQESSNSRKFYLGQSYVIEDAITHLDWTFAQRSTVVSGFSAPIQTATPPTLPFLMEDKVVLDETAFPPGLNNGIWADGSQITRSDGQYIYHSRLLKVARPGPLVTQGNFLGTSVYSPSNFEETDSYTSNGTTYYYNHSRRGAGQPTIDNYLGSSEGWQRRGSPEQNADSYINAYYWYGLWWRFDKTTGATTFSSSPLGIAYGELFTTTNEAEALKAAVSWVEGMHPSDPTYRLWQAHIGNTTAATWPLVEDFLTNSSSFLNRWPPGLVYNETTGSLTIVTGLNGLNTPRIFSKQIAPPAGYANIPIFHLPTGYNEFLTTEQDFLDAGWTAEGPLPQNVLAPLDAYFAFKP
jgi:hypothetical protein